MDRLETSLPGGRKQEKEIPEPETEFKPGQKVNVLRGNLQMETGWQVEDLGLEGTVYIINPAKKISKLVNQKELKEWQEIGFYTGQKICLQNPETKQIEYGWQINEFGQGVIQVINEKTKKQAVVPIEELKTWNDQQTFLPGHAVFFDPGDGLPIPGWQIKELKGPDQIVIYSSTQNKTITVKPEQLTKDLQPSEERYTKKREMKK